LEELRKTTKTLSITVFTAEIRNEHPPNARLEQYL
jgi:hypothetical protein